MMDRRSDSASGGRPADQVRGVLELGDAPRLGVRGLPEREEVHLRAAGALVLVGVRVEADEDVGPLGLREPVPAFGAERSSRRCG